MHGVSKVVEQKEAGETDSTPALSGQELRRAYAQCRSLQRRHDPTFWLATLRLPAEMRPAVWAVYGFVRTADEVVDGPGRDSAPAERLAGLDQLANELELARGGMTVSTPAVNALVDAGQRHNLPLDELTAYLDSMRRDVGPLWITDWDDLLSYMNGSAGTVGRLMAPLLGAPVEAHESFAQLGLAFQLTNFIRDIPEDAGLGRVYLPADELSAVGVRNEELAASGAPASAALCGVIESQVVRARELFSDGEDGGQSVEPKVRRGIRLATSVYQRTLDRVEENGFDAVGISAELTLIQRVGAVASAFRSSHA